MTDRNDKPEWWIELTRMHEEAKREMTDALTQEHTYPRVVQLARARVSAIFDVREALAKYAGLGVMLLAFACSAPDGSDLYRSTTRTYPDGGITEELEPIGSLQHAYTAFGFYGTNLGTTGLGRGALCAEPAAAGQICMLPKAKSVKWFVDPVGFSQADYDQVRIGASGPTVYWMELLGISDLGWSVAEGTAANRTVRIRAGSADSLYPATDSRHWSSIACEGKAVLTEPVPLTGEYWKCDRITVTLDVGKLLDDGAAPAVRTARIRQTAGQALVWGLGLGVGNINGGSIFQRAAANAILGFNFTDRDLCALEIFSTTFPFEIRKHPSTACDGWDWP